MCAQSKHGTDKIESSPWLAVLLLQDHSQVLPVGLVQRLQIIKKVKHCGRAQDVSLCSCTEVSRFPTGSRVVRVWLHTEPSGLSVQTQQLATFSPGEDSKAVGCLFQKLVVVS